MTIPVSVSLNSRHTNLRGNCLHFTDKEAGVQSEDSRFAWGQTTRVGSICFQPGIHVPPPALEVQSLNHWITRETSWGISDPHLHRGERYWDASCTTHGITGTKEEQEKADSCLPQFPTPHSPCRVLGYQLADWPRPRKLPATEPGMGGCGEKNYVESVQGKGEGCESGARIH